MRVLIVMTLCVLVCSPVLAQDDSDAKYGERDGRGGLLFLFDELALNSFGGGFGGKYWLSDVWAIHAGLLFRNTGRENDAAGSLNNESSSTSIGFATGFERHLVQARFSPYLSVSVGYLYTLQKTSSTSETRSSEERTNIHEGVAALGLGVEFWLTRNFSLAGQYDLSVSYSKEKSGFTTTSYPDTRESATDEWTAKLGAGSLILAVYF